LGGGDDGRGVPPAIRDHRRARTSPPITMGHFAERRRRRPESSKKLGRVTDRSGEGNRPYLWTWPFRKKIFPLELPTLP
jgi:hypothetical protein